MMQLLFTFKINNAVKYTIKQNLYCILIHSTGFSVIAALYIVLIDQIITPKLGLKG